MARVAKARGMRKAMSPPEARLWVALRPLRAQGFHFRRQHPMRGYYLDFVCLDRRLIVEVDGASHAEREAWDRQRDAALARDGFKTLRVPAVAVRDQLRDVMDWIFAELHAAAPTRPLCGHPPPEGEGEGRE